MDHVIYFKFSTPKGIRIPVASVKGRRPRPLDDGGDFLRIDFYLFALTNTYYITAKKCCQVPLASIFLHAIMIETFF